jgi:hypothetical protein
MKLTQNTFASFLNRKIKLIASTGFPSVEAFLLPAVAGIIFLVRG